jgi:hypothetical protein
LGPSQERLGPDAARWLGELRQRVFSVAVDNLRRDEEVRDALGRLDELGIGFLLLKGSALRAERQGLAGRFQCDVDVLVRRADLERAEALLVGLGFKLDESFLSRERLLTEHFHLGFHRRGATIELHWDVDSPSPAGFVERLWEESREVDLDGQPCRVLSPEHQLLFGCLHLSRHAFHGGLRWLADLRRLLPVPEDVRERFVEEARGWPRRAVYSPLWLLALHRVPGSEQLPQDLDAGAAERLLLQPLLTSLLLAEPWLGLPAWREEKALCAWLFSERPLVLLLGEVWSEGLLRKVRSQETEPSSPSALAPAPSGVPERSR